MNNETVKTLEASEAAIGSILFAGYELSQKNPKLQTELMRIFSFLLPEIRMSPQYIKKIQDHCSSLETYWEFKKEPDRFRDTVYGIILGALSSPRNHRELESTPASLRNEVTHWDMYLLPFTASAREDPLTTPAEVYALIEMMFTEDEHYAERGRTRYGEKRWFSYALDLFFDTGDRAKKTASYPPFWKNSAREMFVRYIQRKIETLNQAQRDALRERAHTLAARCNEMSGTEIYTLPFNKEFDS